MELSGRMCTANFDDDSNEGAERIGRYLKKSSSVKTVWLRVSVRCPYCRRRLSKDSSRNAIGRMIRVMKDGHRPDILIDPVPRDVTILACGRCKQTFAIKTRQLTALEKAAA